jgi:O-succinylbenzoic acid--CoA ligase
MERADLARRLQRAGECQPSVDVPEGAPVVVSEGEPARFMAAFAAAVAGTGPVFLGDPAWGSAETRALQQAVQSGIENKKPKMERGWLCVPTGGSSGAIKFARHDQNTIAAAVDGFTRHFGAGRVNALGLLPLHHVSGLMAWMRCAFTGGRYRPWSWDALLAGKRPALGQCDWYVSLVPTQLQRLLDSPAAVDWLRRFRVISVGGGPVWPGLAEAAAQARLPVSLGYGMTETMAMVAAQRPEEFFAGDRSAGQPMPHAAINLDADGTVTVTGDSVFRGYWPEANASRTLVTADAGEFDASGRLRLLGRRDAVIITGGKKVQPEEVEAALRATGLFTDVAVVGVPDPEWGESVVACYPAALALDPGKVAGLLEAIASFKRPKRYVAIADWPRNAQGKVSRAALRAAVPMAGRGFAT